MQYYFPLSWGARLLARFSLYSRYIPPPLPPHPISVQIWTKSRIKRPVFSKSGGTYPPRPTWLCQCTELTNSGSHCDDSSITWLEQLCLYLTFFTHNKKWVCCFASPQEEQLLSPAIFTARCYAHQGLVCLALSLRYCVKTAKAIVDEWMNEWIRVFI